MPAPAIHLLRKHRPGGQGASVGVERERLVPIMQNENRVRGETLDDLQEGGCLLGASRHFLHPSPLGAVLRVPQEIRDWCRDVAEVWDEPPKVPRKAKEAPHFSHVGRNC